ncbi:hypothetical protein [Acinetobacter sp. YH12126]|uniref:hypothetical protein n=1 Tax=Acinetobacter sp. YH12126 TaxID=2601111 RepID=UPI0015D12878|nr:hypothetical protein [Acinetobacter sp. YH12126]
MELQNLPMFREFSLVIESYKIESWQIVDFWDKVKLLKVVDNNVNYQSVYRLIIKLVKEGYLTVDIEKSRYGQKTYTESENLHTLRSKFCIESKLSLQRLTQKKKQFENKVIYLGDEIIALEELKEQFPDIQFKIEQLRQIKIGEINNLKVKIRAIESLIEYFF